MYPKARSSHLVAFFYVMTFLLHTIPVCGKPEPDA